jgi:hypothetical protein
VKGKAARHRPPATEKHEKNHGKQQRRRAVHAVFARVTDGGVAFRGGKRVGN